MKPLGDMSIEELTEYRKEIMIRLRENEKNHDELYRNFPGDYGFSINDDYNGEGDEYNKLVNIRLKIDEELRTRK